MTICKKLLGQQAKLFGNITTHNLQVSRRTFMKLKQFLEEALNKGENLKEDLAKEFFNSRYVKDFLSSDLFINGLTRIIKTKEEVTKAVRFNIKNVMKIMDVPTRQDVSSLERKLSQLEKQVDKMGKKTVTVKSLKKKSPPAKKKSAPTKKKAAPKRKKTTKK